MPVRKINKCSLCNRDLSSRAILNHLKKCIPYYLGDPLGRQAKTDLLQIRVNATTGFHCMDIEIAGAEPLLSFDKFLRSVWLECCGHLSTFELAQSRASTRTPIPMSETVERLFSFNMGVYYIYDYGESTDLDIRLMGRRTGEAPPPPVGVRLLSRNIPNEHLDENEGTNSPRYGTCGYIGPSIVPVQDYSSEIYNAIRYNSDELDEFVVDQEKLFAELIQTAQ